MRRILTAFLLIFLLSLPAAAAPQGPYLALTFDDGPSGSITGRLLDGLRQRNVKATFLLCGYRMELYPEVTRAIAAGGHEIGLHGYSHKNLANLSRRQIGEELMKTGALVPEDCRVRFLRPPGGADNEAIRQVAEARGLALLGWSVDPRDWATQDAEAVVRRVVESARDGDVILLHDLSDSSVKAALQIIDQLTLEGCRFVTVSELARLRKVRLTPGNRYDSFPQTEHCNPGKNTGIPSNPVDKLT